MIKLFLHIAMLAALLAGCKRNETDAKAPDPSALEPIAAYATSIPEPSGLAYNAAHGTLLSVSDETSTVYEIDLEGNVLTTVVLEDRDLEGIAVTRNGDTIIVVSESAQSVRTHMATGALLGSISVPVSTEPSHSLEGVTIDNHGHLFVINEKKPRLLMEFADGAEVFRTEPRYTDDMSDICYDAAGDCLWAVSDESARVIKLSKRGELLAEYTIPFTKGEGITVHEETIYIISDADGRLYRFRKP